MTTLTFAALGTWLRRVRTASGISALAAFIVVSWEIAQDRGAGVAAVTAVLLLAIFLGYNEVYDRALFNDVERRSTTANVRGLSHIDCVDLADVYEEGLDWRTVDALLDGAITPASIRERARERIQARTRSLERSIELSLSIDDGATGERYVPVLRFRKGELQDFRTIVSGDGAHLPVLTYRESSAMYLAAIRWCMLGAGRVDARRSSKWETAYEYYAHECENSIALAVVSAIPREDDPNGTREAADRAIRRIRKVGRRSEFPAMVEWGVALIDMLMSHYMIVTKAPFEGGRTVVRIQDSILPHPEEISPSGNADHSGRPSRRFGIRAAINNIRLAVGSRSARITVSAQMARNSKSYHLELIGPEGSFVSRQVISNYTRDSLRGAGAYDRFRGRHGQRYTHLYLRGAAVLDEAPEVRVSFMERPPGSIGLAALGAVAGLFLSVVWASVDLREEDARIGLAAMYLVFPAGLAAWVGFTSPRTVYGAPATTQLVNFATIALSMAGCFSVIANHREYCRPLVLSAVVIVAMATYWWWARHRIYAALLRKPANQ